MRTARISSRQLGGGGLPQCMLGYTPLGVALETPPSVGLETGDPPWVWAWRPPRVWVWRPPSPGVGGNNSGTRAFTIAQQRIYISLKTRHIFAHKIIH